MPVAIAALVAHVAHGPRCFAHASKDLRRVPLGRGGSDGSGGGGGGGGSLGPEKAQGEKEGDGDGPAAYSSRGERRRRRGAAHAPVVGGPAAEQHYCCTNIGSLASRGARATRMLLSFSLKQSFSTPMRMPI